LFFESTRLFASPISGNSNRYLCEAALIDRQTKQLIVDKVEWTRDDTIRAFSQGWGLFSECGNKVMRVLRIDATPITGIERCVVARASFSTFQSKRKPRAWRGKEMLQTLSLARCAGISRAFASSFEAGRRLRVLDDAEKSGRW
jgi:hypothetical protein